MRRFIPLFVLAGIGGLYLLYKAYLSRQPYEWSGTVEVRTITVGSRVGGRVKDVLVREGDHVEAGKPLVILEPGDLEAQKAIATGQLEQAKANLDKLKRGARPEEIEQAQAQAQSADAAFAEARAGARRQEIAAAQARLVAAQAALDKAQLDSGRARQLRATGAIATAEADNAETALRSARAQRDAQAKVVDELRAGTRTEVISQAAARAKQAQASANMVVAGAREEDVRAAQAQVTAAQGRLDQVQSLIDELVVKAPRAARVESLDLRPGDILAPSMPAGTLLEDGQLYVRIYVPETHIGLVHVGQEVPINVDSFPGRSFKGKVEYVSGVGEYSPRNLQTADERADQVFATRVAVLEGDKDLRAGMAAFIKIPH